MSESNLFWFHCGRCGSLFQSPPGVDDGRLCSNCGAQPCTGNLTTPSQQAAAEDGQESQTGGSAPEASSTRGKRTLRKHKNRYLMIKLFLAWSLLLVLIVVGARKLWPAAEPEIESAAAARLDTEPVMNSEDELLFQDASTRSAQTLTHFLTAGTPETRNQFVLSPVTTASRMAHFYTLNPIPNIDPATLSMTASGLLQLPDGKAFEAHWEPGDGRVIDAVFRLENSEWRLDWEHFARYSDYPWPLFLAGTGPDEGEFRLLARERLSAERKNEDAISLVLYAPRFSQPGETSSQSPEFLISRNQRDGQLLDSAFKLARSGGRDFGSTLPNIDPDGMIRVRVKVRRSEGEMGRVFEITSVIACHWLSLDEPGVEAGAANEEEPAEKSQER